MARQIAIAVLFVVVAALGFVATRPEHFRIERSAVVGAPPDVVFTLIDDFHRWGRWSPAPRTRASACWSTATDACWRRSSPACETAWDRYSPAPTRCWNS